MMDALAGRVILSSGWERRLTAYFCGAFGALAMAPFDLLPAVLVPMCAAVWLIDGSVTRHEGSRSSGILPTLASAAAAGWWLGFGFFTAGLWWIGTAFLVEADQFAWALPIAVLGLPALLAVFTALGFTFSALIWSTGWSRVLALAVGLGGAEFVRAHVLTGFPWNEWGMALGGNLVFAQPAAIIGIHGLTLITIVVFALPAVAFEKTRTGRRRRGGFVVLAALSLGVVAVFGAWRLTQVPPAMVPGVRLRIVQPNLAQDDQFRGENRAAIVDGYLALSDRATSPGTPGLVGVTHLVWPESAFPFVLSRDREMLGRIASALPSGAVLLTGAARVREEGPADASRSPRTAHFLNSIQAVTGDGQSVSTADKVHLVPFGEYVPFASLLETIGITHFVHVPGGFEPGWERTGMDIPNLPRVAPIICYEAIFSGEVMPIDASLHRPGLLLNVTNDGWFGRTSGPYQHFSQARLRAIEEGLPLVRAANSGISAIVDPYGRVLGSLPLGVADVLDGPLPEPLPPPFFAQHPAWPFPAILGVLLLATLSTRRRT